MQASLWLSIFFQESKVDSKASVKATVILYARNRFFFPTSLDRYESSISENYSALFRHVNSCPDQLDANEQFFAISCQSRFGNRLHGEFCTGHRLEVDASSKSRAANL